jgi:uncharacterized alkaline shock family protein YloU
VSGSQPEPEAQPASQPELVVDPAVVRETIRLAAREVPGVLRVGWSGSWLRQRLAGSPLTTQLSGARVSVRIAIVARPGQSLPALAGRVRSAVVASLGHQLGLLPGTVTVTIDGVGA